MTVPEEAFPAGKDRTEMFCSYPTQVACCSYSTQHQEAVGSSNSHSHIFEPLCAESRNADKPGKKRDIKAWIRQKFPSAQNFRPYCAAARRRRTDFMIVKRCQPLLEQAEAKGLHFSLHDFPSENIIELSETDHFVIMSGNISLKQPKHPDPGATTYKTKNLMVEDCPTRRALAGSLPHLPCATEGRAPVSPAR